MADQTVSRLGQANAAGSATALFLQKWAGEVLVTFDETNVMLSRTKVRTVQSGKAHS